MDIDINKNEIDGQEEIKTKIIKTKIFEYFYIMLNFKNKTTLFTLFFLHILEIFQLISFAFFEPHLMTWKISKKNIKIISLILSGFRLTPLLEFTPYKIRILIYIILIILTFFFCLALIMQILFRKDSSRIYIGLMSFTHISIAPLTIFLYIPINELFLIIFGCKDNNLSISNHLIKCWTGIHLLFSILSVIGIIASLFCFIFLNFFYFYPFQTENSTIKLNSSNDIILILIKLIYLIRLYFINSEYISIAVLLILSIILIKTEFKNQAYNSYILEIIINIRNSLLLWTYFMLFIAKLSEKEERNGLIYLVFLGYPIIIFIAIMFTKEFENNFNFKNSSLHSIKACLSKIRMLINLVNSFLEKNNYNLKYVEYGNKKDILLKGLIKIHTERCLDEECPLKKFLTNEKNFNIQKQCLLNYMTKFFKKAMKNFPYEKIIILYYIQFNFTKKYNLNSVRANLEYIKKMKNNLKDEFIIYYLEKEIMNIKSKSLNLNDGNELEQENLILQHNYKKLKDLIIKSTKLYAEFWGIFANNITNNLNISKLYIIGENLNKYLKEINNLWENNLENKKINMENEFTAQLYSKFLREILWDKKSSEEVQKKINEEYHIQSYKAIKQNNKKYNMENILESQDCIMFVNSNEKGKCKIFQFSNSLAYLIGYQKHELINKPLEILMPSIFIDGHSKKVEEFIKSTHLNKNSDKESFRSIEKKRTFILIKSKMGYLIPFNAKYTVFDDNDFSNNFIIKANLEQRDAKSMYPYYILTKDDFSVDSISSSAIHIGFSMDLLKKYVIKLNILIRTSKGNEINFFDPNKYKSFEEEVKKVTWVYPNIIYPKNDTDKNKNKKIEDLIKLSYKKKLNLQIIEMKYREDQILGFIFKFSEIPNNNKIKNEIIPHEYMPLYHKNEIIFDLFNLNYIRTITVIEKTGLRNLREKSEFSTCKHINLKLVEKKGKIINYSEYYNDEEEEEEHTEILLTKEKIIELQAREANEIEAYINLLPFYAKDISSYIKQRPNKEQFVADKVREPLIRIDVNNFYKRIEERIKLNPSLFHINRKGHYKKQRSIILGNKGVNTNIISSLVNPELIKNNKEKEDINKDLNSDYAITLSNIFNDKNIKLIKIIDLIIYLSILLIIHLEFFFTNARINTNKKYFIYLDNSYKIMLNILYSKYYITEAIITNTLENYTISEKFGKIEYLKYIKNQLLYLHQQFIDLYSPYKFSSIKFSKKLIDYVSYKNLSVKTLNNGKAKEEYQPFDSAMTKYSTAVYYISTISDLQSINMDNKYSYELMLNLINAYYNASVDISIFLLDEINEFVKKPDISKTLIFLMSLILSILSLYSFYEIMKRLVKDREKSINLFLTIKKNLFEYLKFSAENFSNKLLNEFFGNEENEEESQHEYITNIKSNDINIAKFKETNWNKRMFNKGDSLLSCFCQLCFFLVIYEIFLMVKYFDCKRYFYDISKFNESYNSTQLSHILLLLRTNIIKQYYFNDTLPILRSEVDLIRETFYNSFFHLSSQLAKEILLTSKIDCFLKKDYKNIFRKYLYGDFSQLIESKDIKKNSFYNERIENGYLPIAMEVFEILRYIVNKNFPQFFTVVNGKNNQKILNDEKWFYLHQLLNNLIKIWNEKIVEIKNSFFFSRTDNLQTVYLSFYIVIIIIVTIAYCIIWKNYEERFQNILRKSFDLINLIPKEIKNIIVSKLND